MLTNWKQTFTLIWSGQLVSILSSSIVSYALIFWMSLETNSAEVLALAAMASMVPQSLLGPIVGIYIDRWDRKQTIILSDLAIASCTLVLALLFMTGVHQLWHIYALLAFRSAGTAFHVPAMQASIPLIAPEDQLTRIAGVNQMISSLSNIVGPAIGAGLIAFMDMGEILLVDVVGAIFACTTLMLVKIPRPERLPHAKHLWHEFLEGMAAIRNNRGLGWLLGVSIVILLFIMPVGVLFPLFTLRHFEGGTFEMSLIEIMWGGGMLLGGAVMSLRNYPINRIRLISGANLVVGLAFTIGGLLPKGAFYIFALLTLLDGVAGGIYNSSFISVLQTRIPPHFLGRVLSLYYSLGQLPAAVGLLATGFLADTVGINTTFCLAGVMIMLLALSINLLPHIVALDKKKGQTEE